MAQTYFFLIVLGLPAIILVIAVLAGHFHHGGYEDLLDWKPTRSPQREAELLVDEADQMLAAQNRYRRLRGAPERSLAEVSEHARAMLRFCMTLQLPDRPEIPSGK